MSQKLRVCSVDYLNSAPLVWGMLHGPQQGVFDLIFRVPSICAEMVASGAVHIGNIPVIEYARQSLTLAPGVGVASHGPVRSILLVSKCPLPRIRTLAADSSSRTSVALARIILARRYGVEPLFAAHRPDLEAMLETADAALLIGDPALRLDPQALPYHVADLGQEWSEMTGLPMVFAVWAGRAGHISDAVCEAFMASCRYGRERLEEVVRQESAARSIPGDLARRYLTHHIVNELGPRDYEGLNLYLRYARELEIVCEMPPSLSSS
ncbi:MAG: menaquinone biosynthesis protein [Candidatus Solibacter usitatus]|nr:menaquinone biosynthesis protein [Candidatus Solibacter usitatus]